MSDFAPSPQPSRRPLPARCLVPLAAAALMSLAACGGGGGGAASGPPVTNPSPIGPTPTPVPSVGPTARPSSSPSPGATASPTAQPTAGATPTPAPTPTVTATPGPGGTVSVVPNALSFDAAGSGVPGQTVTAAQTGNTGFVLSTSNCAGIAAVSPSSGSGPFTFTPVAAGTCSYVVTGAAGQTASVSITVTTTTIPQQ